MGRSHSVMYGAGLGGVGQPALRPVGLAGIDDITADILPVNRPGHRPTLRAVAWQYTTAAAERHSAPLSGETCGWRVNPVT